MFPFYIRYVLSPDGVTAIEKGQAMDPNVRVKLIFGPSWFMASLCSICVGFRMKCISWWQASWNMHVVKDMPNVSPPFSH